MAVKTLAQARELRDSVDAGHQPWLLSAESVSIVYARGELGLFAPYAQRVGPGAYRVRSHHGEWEATVYLAQLVCSVNDAVNVLPCSTCAYLNGGPLLTCAAFPG